MYSWVDFTWNAIKGRCPFQCQYCFYQANPRFKAQIGLLRLDEKTLKDNLGENRVIFVGSSVDMWADEVPSEWIMKALCACNLFPKNVYLFQTKNPYRFYKFRKTGFELPVNAIYGTTIETTDIQLSETISKAPNVWDRYSELTAMPRDYRKMVSLEPLLEFDLKTMIKWIREISPEFVSIGADSRNHNLPEPPAEKIKELIQELEKFTEVKIKKNLDRLLK
jgi:protein gp37